MSALTKKIKYVVVILSCLLFCGGIIWGAIWVTHTQSAEIGNAQARCSTDTSSEYRIVIRNGKAMPQRITAKRCDRLSIVNADNTMRLIAFGQHDKHISYDGISELLLSKDQTLDVTLIRNGTYHIHDHAHPEVAADFRVY